MIGIFGGVGSGKSIAADYLKSSYNAYVIKADEIAHRLYRKRQNGYKAIIRICGKNILDEDGNINREKLAGLLYNDQRLLNEVNASIHPMVYSKVSELIENCKKEGHHRLIVYEAALLPDGRLEFIDESWNIYTPAEIRAQRLRNDRSYTDERIREIMSQQPDDEEYRQYCDMIVINDGEVGKMERQIDEIIEYSKRKQR